MAFAEDYNTVPERLREFFTKHPDGSFQRVGPIEMIEVEGVTYLTYTAAAYRTPDDQRPGYGTAWERVPGLTQFTRNSECQNAETSAIGRAIVAVGAADTKKGIATREDVTNRQAEDDYYNSAEYAEQQTVPGLRTSVQAAIDKLLEQQPDQADPLKAWFAEKNLPPVKRMNAAQADMVIGYLMDLPAAS